MKLLRFLRAVLRQIGVVALHLLGGAALLSLMFGAFWCVGKVFTLAGVAVFDGALVCMLAVYGVVAIIALVQLARWLVRTWRSA